MNRYNLTEERFEAAPLPDVPDRRHEPRCFFCHDEGYIERAEEIEPGLVRFHKHRCNVCT